MFDPKLTQGTAYIQPSSPQVSAVGTLGGLIGDFLSVEAKIGGSKTEARQPTADERFAMDLQAFSETKPGSFSWDRKGVREFMFKYPQHTDKAKSHFSNLGVMMDSPQETVKDKAISSLADRPEIIVAAGVAGNMPPEEGDAYMLQVMSDLSAQDAEIARIKRETEVLTAQGTLVNERWNALANSRRRFTTDVVRSTLGPIVNTISQGGSVTLTPEQKAQLGVTYDRLDMNNLDLALNDVRAYLVDQNANAYFTSFDGQDGGLPPKDWEERVLAPIDALLQIGDAFDTPQEQAAARQALISTKALDQLDKSGAAVTVEILKMLGPSAPAAISTITDKRYTDLLGKAIIDSMGGSLTPEGITSNVESMSTGDATALAEKNLALMAKGGSSFDVFVSTNAAVKRGNLGVFSGDAFKTMVGSSMSWLSDAMADPTQREYVSQTIRSDIATTIDLVQAKLPVGLKLEFQNGKFTVTPTPEFNVDAAAKLAVGSRGFSGGAYNAEAAVQNAIKNLPKGLTVDDLNSKLAATKVIGSVGKELHDSIVAPYLNAAGTQVKGGSGQDGAKGGSIGDKLGIDFNEYEYQFGLPMGYLERTAQLESGGDPNAKNPNSTAGGLFQQLDSNAEAYGVGDKFDPVASTEGAVFFAVDNSKRLSKALGRAPTAAELYLAHQQGPNGAIKLLANPDELAVDLVGKKEVLQNGGTEDMTGQQFANLWLDKFNGGHRAKVASAMKDSGYTPPAGSTAASGAPQVSSGTQGGQVAQAPSTATGTDPGVAKAVPEEVRKQAEVIIASKPMDPEVKALIEQLIGVKNA